MSAVHTLTLDLNWELLKAISVVDRFAGEWAGIERREGRSLKHLKEIATVQSVGASTRIEGSRLEDAEVDALLAQLDVSRLEDRDKQEVAGYFEALDTISEAYAEIRVGENELKHLHKLTLRYSTKDEWHRGGYKQRSNAVEALAADGSRTVVFTTTPPGFETEDAMRALVDWYKRRDQVHPLVRVAVFCYTFVTIHPFQDGNGRMSRLLATLLLLQQGYPWVRYVSFEHEIERRKSEYYRVLRQCQSQRPGEEIGPWVHFFLSCLVVMMEKLRTKLELKSTIQSLNDRQRNILRYIQSNAGAQAGGIAQTLGLALPTIKKDLDVLVRSNAVVREGSGRGTHYSAQ